MVLLSHLPQCFAKSNEELLYACQSVTIGISKPCHALLNSFVRNVMESLLCQAYDNHCRPTTLTPVTAQP